MPGALSIGVPYDVFWTLNPARLQPFILAETERRQARAERENNTCWLAGAYVKMAVASALHHKNKYPEKPYPLTPKEPLRPKEAAQNFRAFARKFNARRQKRASEGLILDDR